MVSVFASENTGTIAATGGTPVSAPIVMVPELLRILYSLNSADTNNAF